VVSETFDVTLIEIERMKVQEKLTRGRRQSEG
jgi:hypothetical protein